MHAIQEKMRKKVHPHPYTYRFTVEDGKRYRTPFYKVTVFIPSVTVYYGKSAEKRLVRHCIEVEGKKELVKHR